MDLEQYERERAVKIAAEAAAWKAKWPGHCAACGGWGGSTFQQSHPYGMGSASETLFEPCDALPETQCHRCGEHGMQEGDDGPCIFCGWNADDGSPDQSR